MIANDNATAPYRNADGRRYWISSELPSGARELAREARMIWDSKAREYVRVSLSYKLCGTWRDDKRTYIEAR